MNALQEEIDELKAEIKRYSDELKSPTTEERKDRLLDAIIETRKTLNAQQQKQQGGKFYSVLVCIGVGLSSCYNLVY